MLNLLTREGEKLKKKNCKTALCIFLRLIPNILPVQEQADLNNQDLNFS